MTPLVVTAFPLCVLLSCRHGKQHVLLKQHPLPLHLYDVQLKAVQLDQAVLGCIASHHPKLLQLLLKLLVSVPDLPHSAIRSVY